MLSCPHNCVIVMQAFSCRARKNINGNLYSLNYGKITAIALDPIEKKPLYNYKPGTNILSVGTFGCNLKCSFCQNWTIAHEPTEAYDITPQDLVSKAKELEIKGNIGIGTPITSLLYGTVVYETARWQRKKAF